MASINPPENPAIEAVKDGQRRMIRALHDIAPVPNHEPEMLLMGCVDARIRTTDLGIPDGKALIERNIAALIPPKSDDKDSLATEAILEFAISGKRVKDIVVMGHTDCGGVKGCLCGTCGFHSDGTPFEMNAVEKYLEPLHPVRDKVRAEHETLEAQQAALEQATIRQSYANLMTYPVVQKAVEEGRLKVHGWLIHTDSLTSMNCTRMAASSRWWKCAMPMKCLRAGQHTRKPHPIWAHDPLPYRNMNSL